MRSLKKTARLAGLTITTRIIPVSLPMRPKKYIHEFGYLGKNIEISYTDANCRSNSWLWATGIVVPTTYFVQTGVLDEVISDIYTGENSFGWGGIERLKQKDRCLKKYRWSSLRSWWCWMTTTWKAAKAFINAPIWRSLTISISLPHLSPCPAEKNFQQDWQHVNGSSLIARR